MRWIFSKRSGGGAACAASTPTVENILLAATALGLGSCWVGAFRESAVAEALELPRHLRPLALIPIGYIHGDLWNPPKLPPEEVIFEVE